MGDRGNIAIVQHDGGATTGTRIYLYTHWGGSEIGRDLQRALAKGWRWNDEAYLTRIIFDTMTEGEHGTETGFGISTYLTDNEHNILVVDCANQTVTVETEGGSEIVRWSFADYIALDLSAVAIS